jgi:hypothetical protein
LQQDPRQCLLLGQEHTHLTIPNWLDDSEGNNGM